jgi:hypothetical protein
MVYKSRGPITVYGGAWMAEQGKLVGPQIKCRNYTEDV